MGLFSDKPSSRNRKNPISDEQKDISKELDNGPASLKLHNPTSPAGETGGTHLTGAANILSGVIHSGQKQQANAPDSLYTIPRDQLNPGHAGRADGSGPATGWFYRIPPVVLGLVGLLGLVALILTYGPKPQVYFWREAMALVPSRFPFAFRGLIAPEKVLLPLLTHIFLHANLMHLMMNSLFLIAFGAPLATRWIAASQRQQEAASTHSRGDGANSSTTLIGSLGGSVIFVLFFLVAGIASGIIFTALHIATSVAAVGASGAISALMAASIRIAQPIRGQSHVYVQGPAAPLSDPRVIRFSLAVIGINIAIGLVGGSLLTGANSIAWDAHVAGYLFGLVVFPLFDRLAGPSAPLLREI